jgi:hypothetical protein
MYVGVYIGARGRGGGCVMEDVVKRMLMSVRTEKSCIMVLSMLFIHRKHYVI